MSSPHPPEFVRLCEDAIAELLALKDASPSERGARLPALHELITRIGNTLADLDLQAPDFGEEQGTLADAASRLQAIEMDRGGPHVPRYLDRIAEDLRRIATG